MPKYKNTEQPKIEPVITPTARPVVDTIDTFLKSQGPEFQSSYADYQARTGNQKGAIAANPEEYYKILSVMSHASHMMQRSQSPAPVPAGGAPQYNQGM